MSAPVLVHENGPAVAIDEVRKSADFIKENFTGHFVSWDAFRFCLEIYRRALFMPVPIVSPSLEFGIEDGFASYFRHRDKPVLDYGGELPSGASIESFGINTSIHFDHFKKILGMDLCALPFADNSFASVFISHALPPGEDLTTVFSEVLRVLAPGGSCTYSCDLDEWSKFEELFKFIKEINPTNTLYSKNYHLEILHNIGAVDINYRTFFPAALEAVLVGLMNKMPHSFRGTLSAEIGQGGEVDKLVTMMSDIFCTLIERDLSQPDGPEDAFHIFVTFKKAGALPGGMPVPAPVCAICHGQLLSADISSLKCASCSENYSVHAGVPIVVRSAHPKYKGSTLRKDATDLSHAANTALIEVLPQLTSVAASFYVIYDGLTPVPGLKAPNILTAFLQFYKIPVTGVVALNVSSDLNFKGYPIVQLDQLPPAANLVLFTADPDQASRWAAKLHVQGVTGKLYGIHWASGSKPTLQIHNL